MCPLFARATDQSILTLDGLADNDIPTEGYVDDGTPH